MTNKPETDPNFMFHSPSQHCLSNQTDHFKRKNTTRLKLDTFLFLFPHFFSETKKPNTGNPPERNKKSPKISNTKPKPHTKGRWPVPRAAEPPQAPDRTGSRCKRGGAPQKRASHRAPSTTPLGSKRLASMKTSLRPHEFSREKPGLFWTEKMLWRLSPILQDFQESVSGSHVRSLLSGVWDWVGAVQERRTWRSRTRWEIVS